MNLRAKKSLGQHFLIDENLAKQIVDTVLLNDETNSIVEVGPGKGVLTKYLVVGVSPTIQMEKSFSCIEIDDRMVEHLQQKFPSLKIIHKDILELKFDEQFPEHFSLVGNFPYNISSEILFLVLENKNKIPLMVGMFQKEVAKRITSGHGKKDYGILSVLVQAHFNAQYLFDVPPESFAPPPKVESGVIMLKRKEINESIILDENYFIRVVKAAFNQRRKQLRNSLKDLLHYTGWRDEIQLNLRPEQLSVNDFILLANNMFEKKIIGK